MKNELVVRWKSELPSFFAKLKKYALGVAASATAIWTANATLGLQLDEITLAVCKYIIAFSTAVGLTSQLTMKNPPKEQENG